MARYLGVDLHRDRFTVCILHGKQGKRFATYEMEHLGRFVRRLRPEDEIAVEKTTTTRLFVNAVREKVRRVVVVAPARFRVVAESTRKTDKNDAELLAVFLSKDMLPELRMKDEDREKLHSLCQTRDRLVRQRTQLKNKINNLLAGYGILLRREQLSSRKGLDGVLACDIDPVVNLEVEVLVEQIRALTAGIARLEDAIKKEGEKHEDHEILRSIKGIGDTSASILLSIIGDVNDFESEKKLAAYFGIVPRVSNSNETERSGRITRRGSKLGRTTLVQCALIAKGYSGYLGRFHERVKRRRGGGKANIAVARKLLSIVYHALKNRWVFTNFPEFEYTRQEAS